MTIHEVTLGESEATKEFSVLAVTTGGAEVFGGLGVGINADGERAGFQFDVPHDFTSLTSAVVRVKPDATAAGKDIDLLSYYSADGEAYNTHSESDAASTYSFTADETYDLDVSGVLSSLTAGDKVSVLVTMKEAFGIWVGSLKVRYS